MYYKGTISRYTLEEASWLIAATTCRWIVPHFVQGTHEVCVPGTKLPWRLLEAQSCITRNVDGQVSLVFGMIQNCSSDWMEHLIVKFYELFGVALDHAVFSYAQWIESKMKGATTLIADSWEHLVNSALVLRYHLLSKQIETTTGTRPVGLPLSTVYECDEKTYPGNVLANFDVRLEKAVYGESEVFVSTSLAPGLYSNKATVSAHHDAVISCVKPPVSLALRYRFEPPKEALELLPQLKASISQATDAADCVLLHICPSVDESAFKRSHPTLMEAYQAGRFVEISGRGCMNEEILNSSLPINKFE